MRETLFFFKQETRQRNEAIYLFVGVDVWGYGVLTLAHGSCRRKWLVRSDTRLLSQKLHRIVVYKQYISSERVKGEESKAEQSGDIVFFIQYFLKLRR
jgi:hypothetical protein